MYVRFVHYINAIMCACTYNHILQLARVIQLLSILLMDTSSNHGSGSVPAEPCDILSNVVVCHTTMFPKPRGADEVCCR